MGKALRRLIGNSKSYSNVTFDPHMISKLASTDTFDSDDKVLTLNEIGTIPKNSTDSDINPVDF